MAETARETPEPPDHHVYTWVNFDRASLLFFLAAVRFYETRLDEGVSSVQSDPELASLLDQETLDSYPVGRELERTRRVRKWLEHHVGRTEDSPRWFLDISVSHGDVRFLRSVELMYLEQLRRKRDSLASRATTAKAVLEAVDQELARLREKAGQGVFSAATPYPLVIEQLPPLTTDTEPTKAPTSATVSEPMMRPRAVVLESIEIRDPELRRRCLDLLAQFHQDGEHDRLDTVVSEATRILEDRLRLLSDAPTGLAGKEVAGFAFNPSKRRLVVSEVPAEQEAAHLLYLGVFGFVRNRAHHRMLGELEPERVLQIVGMVDYLISVAQAAQRNLPSTPAAGEPR
jgi:hypothetical protein